MGEEQGENIVINYTLKARKEEIKNGRQSSSEQKVSFRKELDEQETRHLSRVLRVMQIIGAGRRVSICA